MGKREILAGAAFTALAIGASGMIAIWSDAISRHEDVVSYASVGLIVCSLVGLAALLFWPRQPLHAQQQHINQSVSSEYQSGGITTHAVKTHCGQDIR